MKRRRRTPPDTRHARGTWRNQPTCGYCRKRAYPDRAAAKKALRALYPDQRGTRMGVYHCAHGGNGWHLGHRHVWPSWTDAHHPTTCDRCPTLIHIGRPVAHLHGLHLCLDCGDHAEHQAIAAETDTHDTGQQESA